LLVLCGWDFRPAREAVAVEGSHGGCQLEISSSGRLIMWKKFAIRLPGEKY
jgi:hypothetical protein